MDGGLPPFLTVEEAGRLLRIGRTKAYELTREWRATGGRSGLPVIDLGDVLRVPGPAIEQMLDTGLAASMRPEAPPNRRRRFVPPKNPGNGAISDGRLAPHQTRETLTASDGPGPAQRPRRPRPGRQATPPVDQLPLFSTAEPHPEQPLPNPATQPATTPREHPNP